jgi:hypothetical protein
MFHSIFTERMYYSDLSQECQADSGPYVRAVGWLSRAHAFSTGGVSPDFVNTLRRHIRAAWQPVAAGGMYRCEFCLSRTDGGITGGSGNVWIPTADVIYVAPELVLHYIEAHSYRPPTGFVAAVLDCPEQNSEAFRLRMQRFPGWWAKCLADSSNTA